MNQNTFILSGLNFDKHFNLRDDKDSTYYVRNGDITDYTNTDNTLFVQNANSNMLCVSFPQGYTYKGHIKLDLEEYILFLYDGLNSGIYLFNQELCTLIKVVEGDCLDFTNKVYGRFKYISGKRVIYFEDGKSLRKLNLGNIPYINLEICDSCNNSNLGILNCEELKIFKNFTPPNLTIDITEGNIPDGVYQFAICRTDGNDNDDWFIYSDRFNLHNLNNERRKFGFNIKLDCLDYKGEFKLALIAHREDRGTVAQEIGIFETTTKEISITELDSTYYFPISNEQLFETTPVYQSADFIATNSEHLIFGSLKERKDINYQRQANLIHSEVGVFKVPSNKAHLYPSFQSNENYAFEIQGIYKDGQTTNWFHIPNNDVPDNTWFQPVSNGDTWTDSCNPETKLKWEVYNSATLLEVIEANDNGSLGNVVTVNPSCREYKIETTSSNWVGTLTYTDCEGNLIELIDILPDITFCTLNIGTASWVFKPFDKTKDLIQTTEKGQCSGTSTTLTCTGYKLSDRFNGFGSSNCGTITYDSCSITTGVETCGIPITFTGDISNYSFCACYPADDIYDFDITLVPCAFSFVDLGQCGSNSSDPNRDGTCDFKLVARSTFAYYESDIKYPTENFNNLPNFKECKTGIRYHKFPDRTQTLSGLKFPHIHSNTQTANAKEFVYILAPKFSNIQPFLDCLGNEEKDIIGFRIGYKSRDNNRSVIHSGLLYNMREEDLSDCTKSYYPNFPFNDLSSDKLLGTYEYVKAGNINPIQERGRFVPQTKYSKSKFQYISPDIQYQKSDQAVTELITLREENGYIQGEFNQTEELPKVVILSDQMYNILANLMLISFAIDFIPGVDAPFSATDIAVTLPDTLHKLLSGKNYAYNITEYSNYSKSNTTNIVTGNRRRQIKESFYLQPTRQQKEGLKINNFQRESGLFLNLNSDINNPSSVEKSKLIYSDVKNLYFSDTNQSNYKTSSYYVQLKKENKTQYGGLNDGVVRPISDLIKGNDSGYLIKGDVYITKHKYIRKFPLFTKLPLNAPFDTPYVVSDSANVGYPHYWLDVVDRNELLNVMTKNVIGRLVQNIAGYEGNNFYLEPTSNPSKKNCNQGQTNNYSFGLINGIFYTHVIGVSEYYCESEYIGGYREINEVPQSDYLRDTKQIKEYNTILYPELFLYNQQQRNKGVLSKYKMFDLSKDCCDIANYSQDRIIFSLKNDPLSKSDKWTKFLSNNYHQFSHQDGKLNALVDINNYNLLFLFDNAAYVSQSDEGLLTKNGAIYLGVGSIFERRLKKISSEINGLGGSIDRESVVNTPYGTYWADRKRKTFIYFDGNTIQEIHNNLKSYFIHWNDKTIKGVYDPFSKNIYWSNTDWTVSYKPEAKDWISWFDWIPEDFINTNLNFLTVKNKEIWKHNVANHYQTYYGKTYPFEVGFTINNKFKQEILQSIEVYAEFIKQIDWGQKVYTDKFFNKLFLYSDRVSTGIKDLEIKGLQNSFQYKKGENIEVSYLEDKYRINGFKNIAETTPIIKWNNYKYETLNVLENPKDEFNRNIYSKWFNLHLISDNLPELKKLVQLNLTNSKEIIK